jgi:5-methyltetrahydrofolate--homocysteine methyltransferase
VSLIAALNDAVVAGNAEEAVSAVNRGLEEGTSPEILLHDGLIPAMARVGELYEAGEFFVPEMLMAARAMNQALAVLKPLLAGEGRSTQGTIAIGTVQADLHDIGKNLVAMMLEGAGFTVVDLGVDVHPEQFVDAVRQGADVVGISALLTTTMVNLKETIAAIKDAGLGDRAKVIIGGAPVTPEFAAAVGADAYAPDASSAVRVVRELLA